MTREEQIIESARQRADQYDHPSKWSDTYYGFIDGAKWADKHPINDNYFQNGNSFQCVECVWHSVDELPMFDRGENGDMTPFIVDSYYRHIGGVAHSYTRITWKNHIDTHRNREFMWAYESDLFPINCKKPIEQGCRTADQHPQWIPVEKELPKENEEVLAYNAESEEVIACDYHHKMFHCWPEAFNESITHWMQLPQPPQGKEE